VKACTETAQWVADLELELPGLAGVHIFWVGDDGAWLQTDCKPTGRNQRDGADWIRLK
jgi:hypothetical protein